MRLNSKRIIVTGGCSGMGAAAVKVLHQEGANVVCIDVNDPPEKLRVEGVTYVKGNVADQMGIREIISQAVDQMGGLDCLFNIAGINHFIPTMELTSEELDHVFSVNIKGVIFCCQAAYPYLKEKGGSIVNFGSQASFNPGPDSSHYAASKAAVESFTYKIALEWGPDGIRCNTIWPSAWTPLFEKTVLNGAEVTPEMKAHVQAGMKQAFPLGYLGDPEEDIAPVLVFLASEDSRYITGQVIAINGGSAAVH